MGRSRVIRDVVSPYIEILRPIPAVAWIPLSILLWPTEEGSIIYITFLGALFPIVLNTIHGVEQTPEVLVRAGQSLGASRLHIFTHIVLPAALPSICAGLAIGMGVSWFSLLAGEIISGQYGIGYFTWNAYSVINYPDIVVGMLAIGLLGTSSTALVRQLTARRCGGRGRPDERRPSCCANPRQHLAVAFAGGRLFAAFLLAQLVLPGRASLTPQLSGRARLARQHRSDHRMTPSIADMIPSCSRMADRNRLHELRLRARHHGVELRAGAGKGRRVSAIAAPCHQCRTAALRSQDVSAVRSIDGLGGRLAGPSWPWRR